MTNHYRTPEEIERDIERERSGLHSKLHDLNDRLSFEGLAGDFTNQVSGYASDIGQSVSRVVRENPLGVALTGIGIAWLLFGDTARSKVSEYRHSGEDDDYSVPGTTSRSEVYAARYTSGSDRYAPRTVSRHRYGTQSGAGSAGGYRSGSYTGGSYAGGSEAGTYAGGSEAGSWADDRHWSDTDFETVAEDTDSSPTFTDRIWSAVEGARDKASDLAESIRHGVQDAAHSVSDSSHRARAGVRSRTRMTSDAANRMRGRLSAGTEHLSEDARNRVIAARERAIAARRDASHALHARSREIQESYDRQPLVGGAVAFAVGAAVGAMLPHTRIEDEYFGSRSDELYDRAEAIFREERAKVEAVASDTLDEASRKLRETRSDVESAARDAVREVGDDVKSNIDDVAKTAKSSAKEHRLGDVKDDTKS